MPPSPLDLLDTVLSRVAESLIDRLDDLLIVFEWRMKTHWSLSVDVD